MTFTQEQIWTAYAALPSAVRTYLTSPEFGSFVTSLGVRYGLHVNVTGQLSLLTGYMLSGLMNPLQFQQELQGLGIPNAASASIINDLNEQVFKPLQEKVRNAPPEEPQRDEGSIAVAATPQAAPIADPPTARPIPAPPPRVPAAPLVPAPNIAPQPSPASRPQPSVFPAPITPAPPIPVQPPPSAPASALQPAPIYSSPASQTAPAYTPAAAAPPMPALRPTAPPPANLPGTNGPVPEWSGFSSMATPRPSASVPQAPATRASEVANAAAVKNAPHDIMKTYGVDPYREPVE